MTLRFCGPERGMRDVKDAIARGILDRFDEAGIGVASATYDVVGMPPIHVQLEGADRAAQRRRPERDRDRERDGGAERPSFA